MSPLQRLIRERKAELGLSYRQIEARCGGLVSHSTIQFVAAGRVSDRVTDRTLQALAQGLALNLETVRVAAGRSREQRPVFYVPEEAHRLQ